MTYTRTFSDLVEMHAERLDPAARPQLEAAMADARAFGEKIQESQLRHLHEHVQKVVRRQEIQDEDNKALRDRVDTLLRENQAFRDENRVLKDAVETLSRHVERLEKKLGLTPSLPPETA